MSGESCREGWGEQVQKRRNHKIQERRDLERRHAESYLEYPIHRLTKRPARADFVRTIWYSEVSCCPSPTPSLLLPIPLPPACDRDFIYFLRACHRPWSVLDRHQFHLCRDSANWAVTSRAGRGEGERGGVGGRTRRVECCAHATPLVRGEARDDATRDISWFQVRQDFSDTLQILLPRRWKLSPTLPLSSVWRTFI